MKTSKNKSSIHSSNFTLLRTFSVALWFLFLISGCSFKKPGYEEEQRQKLIENLEKGILDGDEIVHRFVDGVKPRPFEYTGEIEVPQRFNKIRFEIEKLSMTDGGASPEAKVYFRTILKDDVYHITNLAERVIRFNAEAGVDYRISMKALGVADANSVSFIMSAPKDIEIRSKNYEINDENKIHFVGLGRLFFSPGARIVVVTNNLSISAEKIIARGKESGIFLDRTINGSRLFSTTPAKIEIQTKEVIGNLRVVAVGYRGDDGKDGLPIKAHPQASNGSPAVLAEELANPQCRIPSIPGEVPERCIHDTICVKSPGDGEDGRDAVPGNPGTDGSDGLVAADIKIVVTQSLREGKISYRNISGAGGKRGIGSRGVPATTGGLTLPIPRHALERSCKPGKNGRDGLTLAQLEEKMNKSLGRNQKPVSLSEVGQNGKDGKGHIEKSAVIEVPQEFVTKVMSEPDQILTSRDDSEKYEINGLLLN